MGRRQQERPSGITSSGKVIWHIAARMDSFIPAGSFCRHLPGAGPDGWRLGPPPPTFRADRRSVGTPEEQARAERKRNHAFYHSKINSITCPVIGAFIIFQQKSRLLLDEQFESGFVENEN